MRFTSDRILNVDEVSWRVLCNERLAITNTGADDVPCNFPCDDRPCITVVAATGKDGAKLPLWVIAKGLTDGTLNMFTRDDRVTNEVRDG